MLHLAPVSAASSLLDQDFVASAAILDEDFVLSTDGASLRWLPSGQLAGIGVMDAPRRRRATDHGAARPLAALAATSALATHAGGPVPMRRAGDRLVADLVARARTAVDATYVLPL